MRKTFFEILFCRTKTNKLKILIINREEEKKSISNLFQKSPRKLRIGLDPYNELPFSLISRENSDNLKLSYNLKIDLKFCKKENITLSFH